MSKASLKADRKAETIRELKKLLKPGSTVYCVLDHVSASGMTRRISLFVMKKNEPRSITYYASHALDYALSPKGGLIVSGCGMDMGFHVVYSLGYAMWPKGTKKPHGSHNGEPDHDGGYALKHRWM